MKIKKIKLLALMMSLFMLSFGMLGCGDDKEEKERGISKADIVGDWDNDMAEISLIFYDDDTVHFTDEYGAYLGEYSIQGNNVNATLDGDTYVFAYANGVLTTEDFEGQFEKVDEAFWVPSGDDSSDDAYDDSSDDSYDDSSDDSGAPEPSWLDITDTMWDCMGSAYYFYADGSFEITDGSNAAFGSYSWDGSSGSVTADGYTTTIYYDGTDLYVTGEDGSDYAMTLVGAAGDGPDTYTEFSYPIENTDWYREDLNSYYTFYDDGTVYRYDYASDEYECDGTYSWDPSTASGEMYINETWYDIFIYDGNMIFDSDEFSYELTQI